MKEAYLLWYGYHAILPKTHRYSLGKKIDSIFIEAIEMAVSAGFLARAEKLPYLRTAIRKIDTLKVLLLILWEIGSLENKKYIALSTKLEAVGKMLGGWHGQIAKQNSAT